MDAQNIKIKIQGLASTYEVEHLARVFFPDARLGDTPSTKGWLLYARATKSKLVAGVRMPGICSVKQAKPQPETVLPLKIQLSRLLYDVLLESGQPRPPWGMLTGVRPVQLLRKTLGEGGLPYVQEKLLGTYDLSQEKYQLVQGIANRQQPLVSLGKENSYSLYVSIPFCPSRCSYCSFVSRSIQKDISLVEPYVTKLLQELEFTANQAEELGLRLESIYIGGGTPTALPAGELRRLLEGIHTYFYTNAVREYTVEAGRPDCTDFEKLLLLKEFGVSRISINPQTMQDEVLAGIGRKHSAADIIRCYEEARKAGHSSINMDLISGLPKDHLPGFLSTVEQVIALQPENITLHTLTLKRASNIVIEHLPADSAPGAMVKQAYGKFQQAGYLPYYLYRQKSTVDNLENTGWSKPGFEGLYNVFIMEETHSILATGAGGSTKLVNQNTGQIERIFNYKYPADYISGFATVLDKKRGVNVFYAGYLDTQTFGGSRAD